MPSFRAIAIAATLTLSAFTSAVPIVNIDKAVGVPLNAPVVELLERRAEVPAPSFSSITSASAIPSASSVPSLPDTPVSSTIPEASYPSGKPELLSSDIPTPSSAPSVRAAEVKGLVAVLSDCLTEVTPLLNTLGKLTKEEATVEVVSPLVADVTDALNIAIEEVNALVDQPLEVVLATVNGVANIGDVSKLVVSLLNIVFVSLGAVLNLLGGVLEGEVFNLLVAVGELVGELLSLVLSIVGGLTGGLLGNLLGLVVPLLAGIVAPVLNDLGLTDVLADLGL